MKQLLLFALVIALLSCGGDVPEKYEVPNISKVDTIELAVETTSSEKDVTSYISVDGISFYEKEVSFSESNSTLVVSSADVSITLHNNGETYYYSDPLSASMRRVDVEKADSYWKIDKVRFYYTLPAKKVVTSHKPTKAGKRK